MKTAPELFWPKVAVGWTDECWNWTGSTYSNGYGQFSSGRSRGISPLAHRASYTMIKGDPGDLVIDHTCHNKKCVNPQHLELVTPQVNTRRAHDDGLVDHAKAGRYNRIKTHCKAGHPYSGENLVLNTKGGRVCRACRNESAKAHQRRKRAHPVQSG